MWLLSTGYNTPIISYENLSNKHHTLLHRQDQQQVSINSSINHKKTNLPKTTTFLQVLPVKVSNGSQTVEVNALLDTGSE